MTASIVPICLSFAWVTADKLASGTVLACLGLIAVRRAVAAPTAACRFDVSNPMLV